MDEADIEEAIVEAEDAVYSHNDPVTSQAWSCIAIAKMLYKFLSEEADEVPAGPIDYDGYR